MSEQTEERKDPGETVTVLDTVSRSDSGATWRNGALIRLRQVTRIYQEGNLEVLALRGVDLDVAEGEFTALAGPSGSGKTTLLNIIGVLDHATAGRVEVAGQDIGRLEKGAAADFRLAQVGFIFQAYNLVPVLSVQENVEYVMLLQGVGSEERRERVRAMLEELGLKDVQDRRPTELSGGQQQRVAVARAIVSEPDLVLADEPTANLDSHAAHDLIDVMRHLNEEHGATFLFSTHDPRVMEGARRLIRLVDGKIESDEVRS
jgi:putative ABC transport system ATP-binding protein